MATATKQQYNYGEYLEVGNYKFERAYNFKYFVVEINDTIKTTTEKLE